VPFTEHEPEFICLPTDPQFAIPVKQSPEEQLPEPEAALPPQVTPFAIEAPEPALHDIEVGQVHPSESLQVEVQSERAVFAPPPVEPPTQHKTEDPLTVQSVPT